MKSKRKERYFRYWFGDKGNCAMDMYLERLKVICRRKDGGGKRVPVSRYHIVNEFANAFVLLVFLI